MSFAQWQSYKDFDLGGRIKVIYFLLDVNHFFIFSSGVKFFSYVKNICKIKKTLNVFFHPRII
jgi:lipid-A-disaccharide synthase-like uncharacterized protein